LFEGNYETQGDMAAKKKLSVEEILAACRTPGGGGTTSNASAEPVKGDERR